MRKLTSLLGTLGATGIVAIGCSMTANAQADADAELLAALMEEGDEVFHSVGCSGCHGNNGEGGNGPSFVSNTYLERAGAVIAQILFPDTEHGTMPAFTHLSNREISAVATYIRNSWGNGYGIARESSVEFQRNAVGGGAE
jgi:mono/diheme cytochrome c family protein